MAKRWRGRVTYKRAMSHEETQRAMLEKREKADVEKVAEEKRQAEARRDFIETAAKTRRCRRRPSPG